MRFAWYFPYGNDRVMPAATPCPSFPADSCNRQRAVYRSIGQRSLAIGLNIRYGIGPLLASV